MQVLNSLVYWELFYFSKKFFKGGYYFIVFKKKVINSFWQIKIKVAKKMLTNKKKYSKLCLWLAVIYNEC